MPTEEPPLTVPCARCRKPRPKRRGKRYCDDCVHADHPRRGARALSAEDAATVMRWVEMGNAVSLELCAAALGYSRETARKAYISGLAKVRAALGDTELEPP